MKTFVAITLLFCATAAQAQSACNWYYVPGEGWVCKRVWAAPAPPSLSCSQCPPPDVAARLGIYGRCRHCY